jgi:glycine/D-amino acid oxidase-like deaminating enzyme
MWGDADPAFWEDEVLPRLRDRVSGFEHPTLKGSYPVDYDHNYYDGNPIVGRHPIQIHMHMACGFGGLGTLMAPAVGRGIMELMYDDGYGSIDLSRFAFDRVLNGASLQERFFRRN